MGAAYYVSTAAFVVNILFMIVVVQFIGGGLFTGCNTYGFFEISVESCQSMLSEFLGNNPTPDKKDMATLALVLPRVEACLFLGMGLGSVYAFAMGLARGTKDVAVVHFMHAVWAICVCTCHAQNAGLFGMTPEKNVTSSEKLVPFVVVTGIQAVLYSAAFFLSSSSSGAAAKKKKK